MDHATSRSRRKRGALGLALFAALALPACGGGGASAPGDITPGALALAPTVVPETLASIVVVEGGPAEQGWALAFEDGGTLPCSVDAQNRLVCELQADGLASGSHTVRVLERGDVRARLTLDVQPPPQLDGVEDDELEIEGVDPLVLVGTDLPSPLRVEWLDERGRVVGDADDATVEAGGARATCPLDPARFAQGQSERRMRLRGPDGQRSRATRTVHFVHEFRSIDGRGNNPVVSARGAVGVALARRLASDYADGVSALAGPDRPSARAISNAVCRVDEEAAVASIVSDMFWQWGQFVDHDIDLSPEADPEESASIAVPFGDAEFDPFFTGVVTMPFHRTGYVLGSSPREQTNEITAYIDASNVYGSDEIRAAALRTLDGTGRLATSEGDLPPFNTTGLPNAGGPSDALFLAGDVRANEQVGLTTLHALFVREHNRIVEGMRARDTGRTGDELYLAARRQVAALMQAITYESFLPRLLGPDALGDYAGYDAEVDAGIDNAFSTAAYRFGHSLLSPQVLRLEADGTSIAAGPLSLREAFFSPETISEGGGLEPLLRGLAGQGAQALDAQVVEDVRSFLFGPPGAGGLDLPALNIQRGRDHGLPSYVAVRAALGLSVPASFNEVPATADARARLAAAYADVADVDLWVGLLSERALEGAMVGEVLHALLRDQFTRLRSGDRFWYERILSRDEVRQIRRTGLADVIRRNTTIGDELADDLFAAPAAANGPSSGVSAPLLLGASSAEVPQDGIDAAASAATGSVSAEERLARLRHGLGRQHALR